jgi:hypothetical protein
MKILLHILLGISTLFASAQLEHLTIENQDFSIVTEAYDIYDSKGEVMKLYTEEQNNDLTFVLSLILKDSTGSCSDKSVQEGTYEINGTDITLYSFWDRRGKAYSSPYGVRIQHYKMLPNHTVKRISSQVYIETERENYNAESGMQYLFNTPQNDIEKEALKDYIESVEKEYKGGFVYGEEAKRLMNEVQEAFSRKMKRKWEKK